VVDRLAEAIEKAGYEVWIYRKDLLPGTWWKSEVKTAIRAGDYFMACFSSAFSVKTGSYMQDELDIAVEQLRLMPRRQGWFLPVKLDECAIPDLPIGLGRTLGDIDVVSLADGEAAATIEILAALGSPRWA
jgi:hypothetical protein